VAGSSLSRRNFKLAHEDNTQDELWRYLASLHDSTEVLMDMKSPSNIYNVPHDGGLNDIFTVLIYGLQDIG
jgi:hypothetical protein